jgi:hypothetical protein
LNLQDTRSKMKNRKYQIRLCWISTTFQISFLLLLWVFFCLLEGRVIISDPDPKWMWWACSTLNNWALEFLRLFSAYLHITNMLEKFVKFVRSGYGHREILWIKFHRKKTIEYIEDTHLGNKLGIPFAISITEKNLCSEKKMFFIFNIRFPFWGKFYQQVFIFKHWFV